MRLALFLVTLCFIGCKSEDASQMKKPDPDFGEMKYNGIDAWDCRLEFDFPHENTHYFAVHVWAGENGPTEKQRSRFQELKRRYKLIWPDIALQIATAHERLETVDDVGAAMSKWLSVHLGEHAEDSVEFVIDLNMPDEGSRAFFIPLEQWKVGDAIVAD